MSVDLDSVTNSFNTWRNFIVDEFEEAERENTKLRALLREAYEVWAGSELPEHPAAETAPEAYAYRVIREMLGPIKRGLR